MPALQLPIPGKSRMHQRACAHLCRGAISDDRPHRDIWLTQSAGPPTREHARLTKVARAHSVPPWHAQRKTPTP